MKTKDLQQFLDERPAINMTKFCAEVDVSKQYIYPMLKGNYPMTDNVSNKLEPVMRKYGYKD